MNYKKIDSKNREDLRSDEKILRLDLKKIQIATNRLLAYTDAKWNARIVETLLLPMQLYKSLFTEKTVAHKNTAAKA